MDKPQPKRGGNSTRGVKMNPRKERKRRELNELQQLERQLAEFEGDAHEFTDLPLSQATLQGLKSAYYSRMTDIQSKALPLALKGKDVLGAARTGSGKTLAFLVPVLDNLLRKKWGPSDGLGALIISPTRELAVQIFEVLRKIGHKHQFSAGLVIGGKNLKDEQERLARMNILVATPGRLLQHMDQTVGFDCDHLQMLVLDEADRILDMGFSACVNAIIANLPKTRQTLLFSATQTKSVKDLARLSLNDPEYVAVRETAATSASVKGKGKQQDGQDENDDDEGVTETPKNLEQHYMIVPLEEKLDVLWSFIKTHLFTKTIVFLSSGKQVRFVYENFRHMRPGVPLLHMHGKQKQTQRLEIYQRFLSAKHSILFATDIAARGLDFPSIDWVVQVDCPEDVETYIHRVGRTARYESKGKALLFLLPSEETGFVKRLQDKKVDISKVNANTKKKQNIAAQLQSAAFQFPEIKFLAQRAFVSYVRSVYLQKDKTVFKIDDLPLEAFASSLGLAGAPKIKFVSKQEASARKNAVRQVEEIKKELAGSDDDESEEEGSARQNGKDESESSDASDSEDDRDGEQDEGSGQASDDDDGKDNEAGDAPITKDTGVKTKYDRMFGRKSQTILSDHYNKLIDRSDEGDTLTGGAEDGEEDFITIKRRDHELNEAELPESTFVSKRKQKMAQSKKAMLSQRGNPSKIVFDNNGTAREIYELKDEEEFKKDGDVKSQQAKFVEQERAALAQADVLDKERQKEKRREKKRKRKAAERGDDDYEAGAALDSADDDDGYESPTFDGLMDFEVSDDDENDNGVYKPRADATKRRKVEQVESKAPQVDLEALALRALGRK
ncbi:ATP-dependent RNA helicase dbp4 [Microbotryomycetes sp. JL221]|nr:ATP-dependent RNA helicase dbp4 [Microbotryomycetes sp. JL221]